MKLLVFIILYAGLLSMGNRSNAALKLYCTFLNFCIIKAVDLLSARKLILR